jgi:hypothetical protein
VSAIEVTPEFEGIAIRIGGTLHLWLDRTKLLAVNSWIMDGRKQYVIEYVMKGGSFTADYDTREKWETILGKLDDALAKKRFESAL